MGIDTDDCGSFLTQANLQTIDDQLEHTVDAQKLSKQLYLTLKAAFDKVAQHLARLESAEHS